MASAHALRRRTHKVGSGGERDGGSSDLAECWVSRRKLPKATEAPKPGAVGVGNLPRKRIRVALRDCARWGLGKGAGLRPRGVRCVRSFLTRRRGLQGSRPGMGRGGTVRAPWGGVPRLRSGYRGCSPQRQHHEFPSPGAAAAGVRRCALRGAPGPRLGSPGLELAPTGGRGARAVASPLCSAAVAAVRPPRPARSRGQASGDSSERRGGPWPERERLPPSSPTGTPVSKPEPRVWGRGGGAARPDRVSAAANAVSFQGWQRKRT
ncbi:PREDICTED: uncharacterized protein LOC102027890 [Chinchilla lanigera]|uniref:uncharacterized protein LOC102027890 n=1 Tax=Chinchilla lanigera TaxID=34839 RepID=UPI00038EB1A1|nr:PREDICTED: uncharacterized protein LOC102027890 [Chinchilla lanigera]